MAVIVQIFFLAAKLFTPWDPSWWIVFSPSMALLGVILLQVVFESGDRRM